jgi:hypothetical protein
MPLTTGWDAFHNLREHGEHGLLTIPGDRSLTQDVLARRYGLFPPVEQVPSRRRPKLASPLRHLVG